MPPGWYPGTRRWMWTLWTGAVIAVPAINIYLGIHQTGLVPRTVLPWPGNSLVAWFLNAGIAMALATLIHWDAMLGKIRLGHFFAVSAESFLASLSVLSRGSFIYHGVPVLFAAVKSKDLPGRLSSVGVFAVVSVFVASFFLSVFAVNACRRHLYVNVPSGIYPRRHLYADVSLNYPRGEMFSEAAGLVVDRWIGIEGVMALQSYPGKTAALLKEALSVSRVLGESSPYEKICNSRYQDLDRTRYQFSSIPGPVALFYYSGKLWLVFCGLFILGLAVIGFELLVLAFTRNPYMCSLLGMMAANNAAQFSSAPRQMLPTYSLIFFALSLIWALENLFSRGSTHRRTV